MDKSKAAREDSAFSVSVRVKPLDGIETESAVSHVEPNTVHLSKGHGDFKAFGYDFVHWSTGNAAMDHGDFASQETVFRDMGYPVVDAALQGYNCTMFAFGQTGSGKVSI